MPPSGECSSHYFRHQGAGFGIDLSAGIEVVVGYLMPLMGYRIVGIRLAHKLLRIEVSG